MNEEEEDGETDKKEVVPREVAEEIDSVLHESIYEDEFFSLGEEQENEQIQEHKQIQEKYQEEILVEGTEEEETIQLDYIGLQMQIILSDLENKVLWDEYKQYVDQIVFKGLQDATLCR